MDIDLATDEELLAELVSRCDHIAVAGWKTHGEPGNGAAFIQVTHGDGFKVAGMCLNLALVAIQRFHELQQE